MSRHSRKRFRRFLASRRRHRHLGGGVSPAWPTFGVKFPLACWIPISLSVFYGVLWLGGAFSVIYPALHLVAGLVALGWLFHVCRISAAPRFHAACGLLLVSCIVLGSCWPYGKGTETLRIEAKQPFYVPLAFSALSQTKLGPFRLVEGGGLQILWQGQGEALTISFAGQTETLAAQDQQEVTLSLSVPAVEREQTFPLIVRQGWKRLALSLVRVVPDGAPEITLLEEPEITTRKTVRFAYKASDDYGLVSLKARVAPTTSSLGTPVEPQETLLDAPRNRKNEGVLYADLSFLPWVGQPVTVQLLVEDGAGHRAWSEPKVVTLPVRSFNNPFARALVEERKRLLENADAATRDEAANIMAGISRQQALYHGDPLALVALRSAAVRLIVANDLQAIVSAQNVLWQTALRLEEGEVGHARQQLAEAGHYVQDVLLHKTDDHTAGTALALLKKTMMRYLDALEKLRSRQDPALEGLGWPLTSVADGLSPEELLKRVDAIESLVAQQQTAQARTALASLQDLIENLRTTPPELTAEQKRLAEQASSLKLLARGQQKLMEMVQALAADHNKTYAAKKEKAEKWARILAQQQLIGAAFGDLMNRVSLSLSEVDEGQGVMKKTIVHMQERETNQVLDYQFQVMNFLEKSLRSIEGQMRRAVTATAPQ